MKRLSDSRQVLLLLTVCLVLLVSCFTGWLLGSAVPALGFSVLFGLLAVYFAVLLVRLRRAK
jgi:uncharacterized membrane protein YfcA